MYQDVLWLDPGVTFPPVERALLEPNGLLAFGGDLSETRLLAAYRQGIFPWYSDNQPIMWWSPDPRLVLYPQAFKCSRSLAKTLRNKAFQITLDQAFETVMKQCAQPRPDEPETWITTEMVDAYVALHHSGHAHSVEVWLDNALVGGLYGVLVGSVFCGESMFSLRSDASKVALYHLCQHALSHQITLIDCQIISKHLLSLGAIPLPRQDYLLELTQSLSKPAAWS